MAEIMVTKRDERQLQLKVSSFTSEDIHKIKQIQGRQWIPAEYVWTIPYTRLAVEQLFKYFGKRQVHISSNLAKAGELFDERAGKIEESKQGDEYGILEKDLLDTEKERKLKERLTMRGYSPKTIKAYLGHVRRYQEAQQTSKEALSLQNYSLQLLHKGYSHAHVNQCISALQFYKRYIYDQQEAVGFIRPKKESKLPEVLSLNEVRQILSQVENIKHKAKDGKIDIRSYQTALMSWFISI